MRRLFAFLLFVTLVFGASYAGAILYHVIGPWSATAIEQDGSLTHMQFGPDLPRPEWVPVYPGAWVAQASRLVSLRAPSGFHSLELGTRASPRGGEALLHRRAYGCGLRGRRSRPDVAQSADGGVSRDRIRAGCHTDARCRLS